MKCCGEDRTTKFCPDCGELLQISLLQGLLSHLGTLAKAAARYRDSQTDLADSDSPHTEWHKKNADRAKRRVAKWQARAGELEKAIAALAEKTEREKAAE